jgi:hypothetical protein
MSTPVLLVAVFRARVSTAGIVGAVVDRGEACPVVRCFPRAMHGQWYPAARIDANTGRRAGPSGAPPPDSGTQGTPPTVDPEMRFRVTAASTDFHFPPPPNGIILWNRPRRSGQASIAPAFGA